MKKTVLATLVLSFSLVGGMLSPQLTADASKWHKGTPSVLRGTYYTKGKSLHSHGDYYRNKLKISPKSFYFFELEYNKKGHIINNGTGFGIFSSTKYTKVGHNFYKIYGYNNAPRTSKGSFYVRIYSGHRVRFNWKKTLTGTPVYYQH